jgi:sugar transferase (PEP-CTERM/EpsH1 system associated)
MKLAVVLSRFPYPLEKGDKLRAYHQIKLLSRYHQINLFCIHSGPVRPEHLHEISKFCATVNIYPLPVWKSKLNLLTGLISGKPFQVLYFHNRVLAGKMRSDIKNLKPDHIYCQLVRTAEYVKSLYDIEKTIDYMDALGVGMARLAAEKPFYLRPVYRRESRRMIKYESLIYNYFDKHTLITAQDRELIRHPGKYQIEIIANGVDTDYFISLPTVEKKYDIVFVGNLSYAPNIHTAKYIVKEILPELIAMGMNARILIAGAQPGQEVLALRNSYVTVEGPWVDIREAYALAHIMLAPMNLNTGLQNKLLEAMSMELPCITSKAAANALNTESRSPVFIAESPIEYAKQVKMLLDNKQMAIQSGKEGREFVVKYYSWQQTVDILNKFLISPLPARLSDEKLEE